AQSVAFRFRTPGHAERARGARHSPRVVGCGGATFWHHWGGAGLLNTLTRLRQQLLTGLSYAIPFIACGGVLLAVAIALAPATPAGPDFQATAVVLTLHQLGTGAFTLMPPVLAGYIAYAIAGRPGLTPGFVGGWVSGQS